MWIFLKKWWFLAVIIILIGIIVVLVALRLFKKPQLVPVKIGTISQVVDVKGKVTSADSVDLSFEKSGRVSLVLKEVGERVLPGETIIGIENKDIQDNLKQDEADVQYQKAKLEGLQSGTRPEELALTESQVTNAENDVSSAKKELLSTLENDYTTAEDAIHNKVDEFFINPRSANPELAFSVTITPQTGIESGRVEVEDRINDLKQLTAQATTTDNITALSDSVKNDLAELKLFLDNTALAVNALTYNGYITEATITQWKDDMSVARTNIDTAITTTLSADDHLKSSEDALVIIQHQLDLEKAGNLSDQVDLQKAEVAKAEAAVDSDFDALAKTYLKSPISGVISKQDGKIGELENGSTTIVSIISDSKFEIDVNIAEADVSKIDVGDQATITLVPYGPSVVFKAVVVSIDPTETTVNGMPTYKTKFQFQSADNRVKAGIMANISIQGQQHQNVLNVPLKAIYSRGGQEYVTVKNGNAETQTLVTTGITDSYGSVEITSGLQPNDIVVIN